jgi:hypothetical protein
MYYHYLHECCLFLLSILASTSVLFYCSAGLFLSDDAGAGVVVWCHSILFGVRLRIPEDSCSSWTYRIIVISRVI